MSAPCEVTALIGLLRNAPPDRATCERAASWLRTLLDRHEELRERMPQVAMVNCRAPLLYRRRLDPEIRAVMEILRAEGRYDLSDRLRAVTNDVRENDLFSGMSHKTLDGEA